MRKHPWLLFWLWLASSLAWAVVLHPLLSPTVPLWLIVVGTPLLYVPVFGAWYFFPALHRFFRRLPTAVRLGVFAWQQQAAVEREQRARTPRIEQEGGGAHWRPGRLVQSIYVEPGHGYTPIGHVDLTKVKPPQRPSPIAPQQPSAVQLPRLDKVRHTTQMS